MKKLIYGFRKLRDPKKLWWDIKDFIGLYRSLQMTSAQNAFSDIFKLFRPKTKGNDGILLTQMVDNYYGTLTLAAANKAIAESRGLKVGAYDVHIYQNLGWAHKYQKLYNRFFISGLEQIHLKFSDGLVFRNSDLFEDQQFISSKFKQIKSQVKTPADLIDVHFDNTLVGDLLYDTYLRFFDKPTIEEVDDKVNQIIEIGLNVYYNFKQFLKSNKVRCLTNSYASYIQHGIPMRLCLEQGIDVFVAGYYPNLIKKITSEFPYHLNNHTKYSSDAIVPEVGLAQAELLLKERFQGKVTSSIYYMKKSPYAESVISEELRAVFQRRKRNVVIFPHEFFDSPHCNRAFLFPDLYLFLKECLRSLYDEKDTTVFVKVHPASYDKTKALTRELVSSFSAPHFHLIDETVSNLNIVELKPDLVATGRGSIGVEMAYFGIPVIALYDNPYVNFNFVQTCMDKDSYFSFLKGEKEPFVSQDKREIYSYYYQAFLQNSNQEEQNILSYLNSAKVDPYTDDYLEYLLKNDIKSKSNELILLSKKAWDLMEGKKVD